MPELAAGAALFLLGMLVERWLTGGRAGRGTLAGRGLDVSEAVRRPEVRESIRAQFKRSGRE